MKIADLAFFILLFSIFVSLNSITANYLGVSQVASPLILLCCITILSIFGISRFSFGLKSVYLIYLVFLSYYIMGLLIRLFLSFEVEYRVTIFSQIANFVTSLLIILTIHQYTYRRMLVDRKERLVFNSLYIPIILSNLYSIYQSLTGALISSYGYQNRASGVFANPNSLGFIANIGLILTIYSLYAHKKFFWLKLAIIPTLLYISVISFSRTSIITSIGILLLSTSWISFKFFKSSRNVRRKSLVVIGVPLTLFVYLVINFEQIISKYLDHWQAKKILGLVDLIFKGEFTSETTSGRTEVVEFGLAAIENRPIFGNGLGYFQFFPKELGFSHGVHNTHLLVLGDAGIIAFGIYMFYIIYIWIKSFTIPNIIGLLSFGCITTWVLQSMGGHNGLNDKMANILIVIASMYLAYGISVKKNQKIVVETRT